MLDSFSSFLKHAILFSLLGNVNIYRKNCTLIDDRHLRIIEMNNRNILRWLELVSCLLVNCVARKQYWLEDFFF